MTDWFASPFGSNGNGLSLGAAKTTLAGAVALMSGGDRLNIDNNTWLEALRNTIPGGGPGAPTIIRAINRNAAILRPTGGIDVIRLSQNYITIDGIDADAVNCVGSPYQGYNGGIGVTNLVLMHGTARNANGIVSSSSGIMGGFPDGRIWDMDVFDNGLGGGNQDHGLYTNGPRAILEDNRVRHNGAYGLHLYPFANDCIVRRNIFAQHVNRGMLISGGSCQFYNNICDSNAQGLEVQGDNHLVHSNTLWGNGAGTYTIWINGGSGVRSRNNILFANASNLIQDDGVSSVVDHNLDTDPAFVNAAGGDFKLLSSSFAIGQGVDLSTLFTTDFDSVLRTTPWTIGAYGFGAVVPVLTARSYGFMF